MTFKPSANEKAVLATRDRVLTRVSILRQWEITLNPCGESASIVSSENDYYFLVRLRRDNSFEFSFETEDNKENVSVH